MTAPDGLVLVTGGSRGIGAATAALLAQQGQRVVIVDIAPEALADTQTMLGLMRSTLPARPES
jgi:NAD(P)-dependent dehydrogenase (short-subunit alcohol dehydrogenase family)